MQNSDKTLRFFLGANTPQGFVSRFDQLGGAPEGWQRFVLKGGPGTGKSSCMKRLAELLEEAGEPIERIHCSSDIDSLDAVICPGKRMSMADGTAPHVIEPRYPGACETLVCLGDCWNSAELLAHREEIVELTDRISRCHERCCRFLAAAAALEQDTCRVAEEYVNLPKLRSYAQRLAAREFGHPTGQPGSETVRFYSAVTAQGVTTFPHTAELLCSRIYAICDPYGVVSRPLLYQLRAAALRAGYHIITSYCPLFPYEKIEELFIPELRLGFMTDNHFHPVEPAPYRRVHARRFLDMDLLKLRKQRISFNRKATAQMLEQASISLAEAKALHDELEGYYIAAMDFDAVKEKNAHAIDAFLR